jgi:hypothetical protein
MFLEADNSHKWLVGTPVQAAARVHAPRRFSYEHFGPCNVGPNPAHHVASFFFCKNVRHFLNRIVTYKRFLEHAVGGERPGL